MKIYEPPDDDSKPWPFIRRLIHLEVAESTNDVAKALAVEGSKELPLVVWADRQTRGRGQRDRTWWSDTGSLTFSLLLDPRRHGLRTPHEPLLALATAVAVTDYLQTHCGLQGEIRWPNDIDLDGRKLGGILPERVDTPRGTFVVVGIGLNVATELGNAPEDVRRMAVSIGESVAQGRPVPDMASLLRHLLGNMESIVRRLARDDARLASEWQGRNSLLNRAVRIDLGTHIVAGICRAIDVDGALLVEVEGETVRLFGGRVLRD